MMDLLSDIITVLRIGRPIASRLRLRSPLAYRFAPYDGMGFHLVLRGSGWLLTEGHKPVPLGIGDVVLVSSGCAHVLSTSPDGEGAVPFDRAVPDPAGDTEFLCGKYRLDRSLTHPFLAELPEIVHLPARLGSHDGLSATVDLLGRETSVDQPGRDAAIAGLLDLLLVYFIRAWFHGQDGVGWPRALRDPVVVAALDALHGDPGRPWQIADLAAEAGISRATLARRFTDLVGQSPIGYLTRWRMTLAARLLRDTDVDLTTVAQQVGYATPFAFSHAFKREFGVAPGRYREQVRQTSSTRSED